jgi:L-ascorbate metabolism protein UlaG (beta-lactamase superfamily)
MNFWPNFDSSLPKADVVLWWIAACWTKRFWMHRSMVCGAFRKAIDAVIVSHMHGDHFLEAPIREKVGH